MSRHTVCQRTALLLSSRGFCAALILHQNHSPRKDPSTAGERGKNAAVNWCFLGWFLSEWVAQINTCPLFWGNISGQDYLFQSIQSPIVQWSIHHRMILYALAQREEQWQRFWRWIQDKGQSIYTLLIVKTHFNFTWQQAARAMICRLMKGSLIYLW